jgi:hypothetical protein
MIYTCRGTNHLDNINVKYNALNKIGQKVNLHCINGTFVNV